MEHLPIYISILFVLTTFLTLFFFYKAAARPKTALIVLLVWMSLQTAVGISGFYTITDTIPPRFLLLVGPPLILIIVFFASAKGRQYIDSLNPKWLTLLHVVRVPVELVLFWLFLHKTVPQLMTFEGRNPDILSGITAPLIFYFGYVRQKLNRNVVLLWNFICLGLLINIVTHAILSAPFPFQKLAFDQPNIAVFYFPFVWLPGVVVPLVLFSHLASIRHLMRNQ